MENPFARALLAGTFRPGDTVVADADPVSGTLVFSTDASTVVANVAERRDARVTGDGDGAAGARTGPAFDLPPLGDRKGSDGGGLVN